MKNMALLMADMVLICAALPTSRATAPVADEQKPRPSMATRMSPFLLMRATRRSSAATSRLASQTSTLATGFDAVSPLSLSVT